MVEDAVVVTFESSDELPNDGITDGMGQSAPVADRLFSPRYGGITPERFEIVLEDVQFVERSCRVAD